MYDWTYHPLLKRALKRDLRDHMTNLELVLNSLAEASTTELARKHNPKGLSENATVAKQGADVAKVARENLEKQLGQPVVSALNAKDLKRLTE